MKTIISLILLFSLSISFAQEVQKVKELGITFEDFYGFGITYRFGHENAVWRVNAINSNNSSFTNDQDLYSTTNNGINLGASIGREIRKPLRDNFELRYGVDVGFSYSKFENKLNDGTLNRKDTRTTYTPNVGLVLGFNYLTPQIIIGAELTPSLGYTTTEVINKDYNSGSRDESLGYGYSTNFSSLSALISVAYRLK